MHKLLESGEYMLVNNTTKAIGGPFTRVDPHDPDNLEKRSLLDLCIVSKNLFPFLNIMIIDKERKVTPFSSQKMIIK